MNRKIILLLIIMAVIFVSFVSGRGSTKNDEDQAWLRSTKSDMEMIETDKLNMLNDEEMHLSNLDDCDILVKDAQKALRNNHMHSPTSSKFQKARNEWDIILNDYIGAAEYRYVAVQKWNDPNIAYDSSVGDASYEARNNSNNKMLDAQDHYYILSDYIRGE